MNDNDGTFRMNDKNLKDDQVEIKRERERERVCDE